MSDVDATHYPIGQRCVCGKLIVAANCTKCGKPVTGHEGEPKVCLDCTMACELTQMAADIQADIDRHLINRDTPRA